MSLGDNYSVSRGSSFKVRCAGPSFWLEWNLGGHETPVLDSIECVLGELQAQRINITECRVSGLGALPIKKSTHRLSRFWNVWLYPIFPSDFADFSKDLRGSLFRLPREKSRSVVIRFSCSTVVTLDEVVRMTGAVRESFVNREVFQRANRVSAVKLRNGAREFVTESYRQIEEISVEVPDERRISHDGKKCEPFCLNVGKEILIKVNLEGFDEIVDDDPRVQFHACVPGESSVWLDKDLSWDARPNERRPDSWSVDLRWTVPADLKSGFYWLQFSYLAADESEVLWLWPVVVGDWDGKYEEEVIEEDEFSTALESWKNDRSSRRKAVSWSQRMRQPAPLPPFHPHLRYSRISGVKRTVYADGLPRRLEEQSELIELLARERADQRAAEHASRREQAVVDQAAALASIRDRITKLNLRVPRAPSNSRDFEELSAEWLKAWGLTGVELTSISGDSGIDVLSDSVVGQVKFYSDSRVGRPEIQNLKGAATMYPERWPIFFAYANGYTSEAVVWANQAQVVLLEFSATSLQFEPSNLVGKNFCDVLGVVPV